MEETLSLHQVVKLLKKRKELIIWLVVIAALCSAIISYFVLPKVYQTSSQILVNQELTGESKLSDLTIAADLQLMQTYSDIIKSPAVIDKVIEELKLNRSFDQLNQSITLGSATNSQVLNITVKDADPATAVAIANKTAEIIESEAEKIMKVKNITILNPAKMPENPLPVEPNPMLNTAMAAVAGLILGIGIAFILEYLDTTIKNGQEIKDLLGVPLIGSIPLITEKEAKKNIASISFKKKEL